METEIVLPETSPETEWIAGRAVRKVSPQRDHARVQLRFAVALDAWADGRGEVGTEWRFRVAPVGEVRRPLVPDVAFVATSLLTGRTREELAIPAFAPSVAVEVLSPDDRPADLASKIDVYLRAGTLAVVVVDPCAREIALHDAGGRTRFTGDDVFAAEAALPGFRLALAPFFARALDPAI